MSFDGFFTHAIVNELRKQLLGGRINKIYQPFDHEIHLQIRANRKNQRLLASTHPNYYRLHLTEDKPQNPQEPPLFVMVLRKHIESARIVDIQQKDNDRIIIFDLESLDEVGDRKNYQLIFELMGRHSNIVLIDVEKQTIIDSIKRIPPSINRYRQLLPGSSYIYPPSRPNQVNIMNLTQEELTEWTNQNKSNDELFNEIQGLSKRSRSFLEERLYAEHQSFYHCLTDFIHSIQHPDPNLIYQEGKLIDFYACDLRNLPGKRKYYATLSELLDEYFADIVRLDRIRQLTGNLDHQLKQLIKRNQKKINNLQQDRKRAKKADDYRLKGELLNAYAYQIEKGLQEVEVDNYYDKSKLSIDLLPQLTAIENSQRYYRLYTKYRDSLKYIKKQLNLAEQENHYLESILVQLNHADLEDIELIQEELREEGYLGKKRQKRASRAKKKKASEPRRFYSSDGSLILVGRNNKQNDALSLKTAAKNHWWLHTKDIPGSHVIIQDSKPSDQCLREAASIAAYYSKAKDSANVPVDYLQVRHLRKPNGAKPGFVIYEGQKTLYVTPSFELIQQLAAK